MQKMTWIGRMVIVLCTCMCLTACGQKGDLYLPEGKTLLSFIG